MLGKIFIFSARLDPHMDIYRILKGIRPIEDPGSESLSFTPPPDPPLRTTPTWEARQVLSSYKAHVNKWRNCCPLGVCIFLWFFLLFQAALCTTNCLWTVFGVVLLLAFNLL